MTPTTEALLRQISLLSNRLAALEGETPLVTESRELASDFGALLRGDRSGPMPFLGFRYRNHRGTTEDRRVLPLFVSYGECSYHGEGMHYLLSALCADRNGFRQFKMTDVLAHADGSVFSVEARDPEEGR